MTTDKKRSTCTEPLEVYVKALQQELASKHWFLSLPEVRALYNINEAARQANEPLETLFEILDEFSATRNIFGTKP